VKARAVIGANFGDEGKGLVTDYLCSQGAGTVVRFNGGAQAGHTVVTPHHKRHVFGHIGSGAFEGIPTFLSNFFICNPVMYFHEAGLLASLDIYPQVFAHPDCLVSTFADMLINQYKEDKRGSKRHGSCGVGVNETVNRSLIKELRITMSDLWNRASTLEGKITEICDKYAKFRTGRAIKEPEMCEAFVKGCWEFANVIHPAGIQQCKDPVFEGAQGLLLDQNNKEFYPHVTRSNTGIQNVRELCAQAKIDYIETYYVSRTYLTRHGAGPLPGEDPHLNFEDDTNVNHPFQGHLRFAPLNTQHLIDRCVKDFGSNNFKLVLTHCDQLDPVIGDSADLYSYGVTRSTINGTSS
jgi:adenylosuccinate synthase